MKISGIPKPNSYRFYNNNSHAFENITTEERNALLELASLDDIVVQKSDKGNLVVIFDKDTYLGKMRVLLSDTNKFIELYLDDDKILDELLLVENEINKIMKPLNNKGVLTDDIFRKLSPVGSQPGRMYGLCKVHKDSVNGCPPLRPILSAINTPHVFMTSLDADSLFTNIPLNEIIDICINELFQKKNMKIKGQRKNEFRDLLELATRNPCSCSMRNITQKQPRSQTVSVGGGKIIFLLFL